MNNIKKRVLITGVTGMVGSHLVDYLLDNTDWLIYGMCRWRSPLNNVSHLLDLANQSNRLFFLEGDLLDSFSLANVVNESKPDFIFHLAAQSFPRASFDSPIVTLDTNILGTTRLLEVLRLSKYRDALVHVCSSSEVFGRVSKDKLPINEECHFHPASPYSISKIGTDYTGRYYAEAFGMNIIVTRMFTHTGPRRGDIFAESTFAKQIALIENGLIEPVIRVGNLESLRTWSDVRDAVRAYYMLLTMNPISGEYYNIGGSFTCTVQEMLEYLMSKSTVKNIKIIQDKGRLRALDADAQIPDTRKFTEHTGWLPEISFEKTMDDLLSYWRSRIAEHGPTLTR
jgi:GDP-mannose 4,6-dehydratase